MEKTDRARESGRVRDRVCEREEEVSVRGRGEGKVMERFKEGVQN